MKKEYKDELEEMVKTFDDLQAKREKSKNRPNCFEVLQLIHSQLIVDTLKRVLAEEKD